MYTNTPYDKRIKTNNSKNCLRFPVSEMPIKILILRKYNKREKNYFFVVKDTSALNSYRYTTPSYKYKNYTF